MVQVLSVWPSCGLMIMKHLAATKNTMSLEFETHSPMPLNKLSVFLAEGPLDGPAPHKDVCILLQSEVSRFTCDMNLDQKMEEAEDLEGVIGISPEGEREVGRGVGEREREEFWVNGSSGNSKLFSFLGELKRFTEF